MSLPALLLPSLPALLPIFLVGLAGSVHCIGMCGGIVGALSAASPGMPGAARSTPSPAPAGAAQPLASSLLSTAPATGASLRTTGSAAVVIPIRPASAAGTAGRVLAYNSGRIASYMAAGALAGGLAGGAEQLAPMLKLASLQLAFYWLANLMLAALGLYLMDAWRGLLRVEAAGQFLWRRLAPLAKRLLPMDSVPKALVLGALWGWLPCGMVYSVLLTALMSGSAVSGAAVMLAFGLGTLPMLFGLGMAGGRLRGLAQRPGVRRVCGLLVLAFGMLGLVRAGFGVSLGWMDALCLTGH
jgi:sulfite exporter TauE/SafE